MFSEGCSGSVGRDRTAGAGFRSGHALDFGQRCGAGFGNALLVEGATAKGVARSAIALAGLTQLGVDARFDDGAAFGAGYVDIAIGNAQGDGFLTGLRGGNGKRRGDEGDQGKNETHGMNSGVERVFRDIDAADRHSVAV